MVQIIFVRHGQAQSQAKNEQSYDKLSALGQRQSDWLGAYLRSDSVRPQVISGAMTRQIETARRLGNDTPHYIDQRLNEFDYFGLKSSLRHLNGIDFLDCPEYFPKYLRQMLILWRAGEIDEQKESYQQFRMRIFAALRDGVKQNQQSEDHQAGQLVFVTSTGVISSLCEIAQGLNIDQQIDIFLCISHTSVNRFDFDGDRLRLLQFGYTPHLDHREHYVKTYF